MTNQKNKIAVLYEQSVNGDKQALEELCAELGSYIRQYFEYRISDPDLINDLSQEAYLRLLQNLPNIREPVKLKGFVIKTAFHIMRDYLRKKLNKYRDIAIGEDGTVKYGITEKNFKTMQSAFSYQEEEAFELKQMMEALPEKTANVLQLKAEGYKYKEIAYKLNLSESAVKMHVTRGYKKLKKFLSDVTFCLLFTTI